MLEERERGKLTFFKKMFQRIQKHVSLKIKIIRLRNNHRNTRSLECFFKRAKLPGLGENGVLATCSLMNFKSLKVTHMKDYY